MDKEKVMTEAEWLAKYNASQKKSKKKSAKKWVRNGVALGLVAVLSIAGTLAYLQKQSEEKTNTFVGSTGLKLMLTENKWDPNNDGEPDDGEPSKEAQAYIPGNSYTKNPQLINGQTDTWSDVNIDTLGTGDVAKTDTIKGLTGYAYSEYVALQMDLKNTNSETATSLKYSELKNVIEPIVFDSGWTLIAYSTDGGTSWSTASDSIDDDATNLVFAYKTTSGYTELKANTATSPLFDKIAIKQEVKNFDGTTIDQLHLGENGNGYPKFDIVLKGAATDTETYDRTDFTNTTAQQQQIEKDLLAVLGITIS